MPFLNNIKLFFSAIEKVLNNFKSRPFPNITQDKTLKLESEREPTSEPVQGPAQKLAQEPRSKPT